jgi:hypothetical protein
MNRHGKAAQEYWATYRPRALSELGDEQAQSEFFTGLGLRVMVQIGETKEAMLAQIPLEQRSAVRTAVASQAQELVYENLVYLDKEPGTEAREIA